MQIHEEIKCEIFQKLVQLAAARARSLRNREKSRHRGLSSFVYRDVITSYRGTLVIVVVRIGRAS